MYYIIDSYVLFYLKNNVINFELLKKKIGVTNQGRGPHF